MPYEIVKSSAKGKQGYRVKKAGTNEFFSKEPLTLDKAKKQRTAIIMSELGLANRPKAKNMMDGGMVPKNKFPAVEGRPKDYGDVVPAILEPGEVVIPVEHAPMVAKYLKKMGVSLPGM